MKTLAIIPAYNEAKKIHITVKKTVSYVNKAIVIDDGSIDNTSQIASRAGAEIIKNRVNSGAGFAIREGIKYAIKHKYGVCVVLGGDDQDVPSEIPVLLKAIKQGYDFVQGSRYIKHSRTINIPLFRRFTTKSYSLFFSLLLGVQITDGSNGFRAFKTSIFKNKKINIWQDWLNRYELEPYLYYQCIKYKYKVKEVPVTKKYPIDKKGFSKMIPFLDWWRISRPIIFLKLGIKK